MKILSFNGYSGKHKNRRCTFRLENTDKIYAPNPQLGKKIHDCLIMGLEIHVVNDLSIIFTQQLKTNP